MMAGTLKSEGNNLIVSLNSTDEYTFRAGGSVLSNPKDVVTTGMSKIAQATALSAPIQVFEFLNIPSWARRVTLSFDNLNLSTASTLMVRVATGTGSYAIAGYGAVISILRASTMNTVARDDGFPIKSDGGGISGSLTMTRYAGNVWAAQGCNSSSQDPITNLTSGRIYMPGALERVQIISANPAYSFTSGLISATWE